MSARHLAAVRPSGRGLPSRLPEGERLLWQGSPSAAALMRRMFHVRLVAAYFATILAISAVSAASRGMPGHAVGMALLHRALLAAVPLLLMAAYAWAIQRSTVYSITTERVVFSFGIALPVSFNIPFTRIAGAELRLYPGGGGDLPLRLLAGESLSYFVMWPHARPWRLAATQPMLRCVPRAEEASMILADALAQHAGGSALSPVLRAVPAGQAPAGVAGQALAA